MREKQFLNDTSVKISFIGYENVTFIKNQTTGKTTFETKKETVIPIKHNTQSE